MLSVLPTIRPPTHTLITEWSFHQFLSHTPPRTQVNQGVTLRPLWVEPFPGLASQTVSQGETELYTIIRHSVSGMGTQCDQLFHHPDALTPST